MIIISVIEDEQVIEKILKHLGLWDQKASLRPVGPTPRRDHHPKRMRHQWLLNTIIDYTDYQVPVSDNYL